MSLAYRARGYSSIPTVHERRLTIAEVVARTTQYLASKGSESPRLDAELLVGHALGLTRLQLYLDRDRPLTDEELARARELVRRRAAHEPVAYIVGKKEFYGRDFLVTPAVLIPRPETELLVEHVAEQLLARFPEEPVRVLDFGVGSGAIAVTLALLRENLTVVATEISEQAVEVARTNAQRHGVADRVEIRHQADFGGIEGDFHAVVSNPPYIGENEAETLPPDVVQYEPHTALFAGPDGMRWIEWLLAESRRYVRPDGGFLALEIGAGMTARVRDAAARHGWLVEAVVPDFAGIDRVVRCVPAQEPDAAQPSGGH